MKLITLERIVVVISLGLVIVPPLAFMLQKLDNEPLMKGLMLAGTVLWFATAPIWIRNKS